MARSARDLELAMDALDVVLRRVSALPESPESDELRVRAEGYLRLVQGWAQTRPALEDRERMMKRILALHVLVARLERGP